MKIGLKISGIIANLLCFVAGGWVCAAMLLKLDSYFVFFIPGMSSAEAIYFNMIMFVLGVAGLMFVIPNLSEIKAETVEFPTLYAIIPLIISVVSIINAFSLETPREKIIVILSAIIYFFLSSTIIYNTSKIFQAK